MTTTKNRELCCFVLSGSSSCRGSEQWTILGWDRRKTKFTSYWALAGGLLTIAGVLHVRRSLRCLLNVSSEMNNSNPTKGFVSTSQKWNRIASFARLRSRRSFDRKRFVLSWLHRYMYCDILFAICWNTNKNDNNVVNNNLIFCIKFCVSTQRIRRYAKNENAKIGSNEIRWLCAREEVLIYPQIEIWNESHRQRTTHTAIIAPFSDEIENPSILVQTHEIGSQRLPF